MSGSFGTVSASCTISFNSGAGTVTFTGLKSADSGGYASSVYYQRASAEGVYASTLGALGVGAGAGSGSASYSATAGQWFRMWLYFQGPGGTSHQVEMYYQAVNGTNKVTVSLPINHSEKPKTYRLYQGGVLQGEVTLDPGEGLIQTFTVPVGTDVTVVELVEDLEQDGPVWVSSLGTVTEKELGAVSPTLVPSGGSDPSPVSPGTTDVQPNATATTQTSKQVWEPSANVTSGSSDFTVKAYREGVDKLVATMVGDAVTGVTAADPAGMTPGWQPNNSVVTGAYAKLPAPPTFSGITPASTISFGVTVPKMDGSSFVVSKTIDFAAEPYAGPIALFRGAMVVLMTLIYFVATFYTVRGAFVSK